VTAVRRVQTSSILLALVVLLCLVGLVMVGSASEIIAIDTYGSPWAIFIRECMWVAVGGVALFVTCRFDYRRWRKLSGVMVVVTMLLLLAVLVPGIGTNSGGSSRWIGLSSFGIQPSELMKLAIAIFGADLVVRREQQGRAHRTIVGPLLLVAAAAAGLILLQPDMGTALIIGCITMAILFASGAPMKPIAKVIGVLAVFALIVGLIEPYRRARLLSFLNPGAHASGSGYQVVQSLIGLGSGHFFGVGLGNGREKWGYLPNAHTDFIFSVVGEELGLVGAVCLLALLVAFCWFGLRAATRAPDRFGGLLAVALVVWIAAETVVNVGAVVGLLPVTGIPLPFISFGGTSLVITMVAAGILINIARQERAPTDGPRQERPAAGSSRRERAPVDTARRERAPVDTARRKRAPVDGPRRTVPLAHAARPARGSGAAGR
jgi:cell division protein FtsW